jgi:hypothetical protein
MVLGLPVRLSLLSQLHRIQLHRAGSAVVDRPESVSVHHTHAWERRPHSYTRIRVGI